MEMMHCENCERPHPSLCPENECLHKDENCITCDDVKHQDCKICKYQYSVLDGKC